MTRRLILSLATVAMLLPLPSPSPGTFHQMLIREIFPGSAGQPNAQYVMLQMYAAGQNFVSGHSVTFYDAAGAVAGTFTFSSDVANGTNQSYILLATTEAETFFSITADLVITPVITAAGGKVCYEDIDCVSWGSFTGSSSSPSPSGTRFGYPDGLLTGHAIQRDISHGNPSSLQEGDDTDDSHDDFDCVATATPINNANTSATSYTDASPCSNCGNGTKEFGEQCDGGDAVACPGGCQSNCLCPAHDSVVLPVRPIKAKVSDTAPMSVTKNVKVKVVNADINEGGNDTIMLTASSDCPAGVTLGTPNFGAGDSVVVDAGRRATATVAVTITDAAFTTFNSKAAKRCTLTFTSTTVASNPPGMGGPMPVVGNLDPTTSNNSVTAELNVFDENDAETASPPHESYSLSMKPLKVTISAGDATKTKKTKPGVGNADILPAPDIGDSINVTVDVSACPGPPTFTLDMDRDAVGNQSSKAVDGGKTAKGQLLLTFDASALTTPNKKSPHRCTAIITAVGPDGLTDPDPTNNATKLLIDIIDKNDL